MTLLNVVNLHKHFPLAGGRRLVAVDDVSFEIETGDSLGLVGESGSGKSTIAGLVSKLLPPDSGSILLDGRELARLAPAAFSRDPARRRIQLVFQSAEDGLNPAFAIARSIAMGTGRSFGGAEPEIAAVAAEVGLAQEFLSRRPHQLSGGQLARAGIARALIARPDLLVLDEPTASLDVSVQAAVLKLVDGLRRDRGMAMLFVSHDLDVIRLMCTKVMVLYLGRVAEYGVIAEILARPAHPYTRALIDAIPGRAKAATSPLKGEPLSPIDPPNDMCLFHTRCRFAIDRCRRERPVLREAAPGQMVACHRLGELPAQ